MKQSLEFSRFLIGRLACLAVFATLGSAALAANKTWDGGGPDSLWTSGPNWNVDTAPAPGTDALEFDGILRLTNTNDFAINSLFTGLSFNAGAGAFVLNGNAIKLGGSLNDRNASFAQTINLNLELTGSTHAVTVVKGGNLVINSVISSGTTISSLIKQGGGTLTLSNSNTYLGATTINGGIIALGTTGALPSGQVTFGNGELSITGDAITPRSVNVGPINFTSGKNIITLTADAAQSALLTGSSLGTRVEGSIELFRGTGLGTSGTGTAGIANIVFTDPLVVSQNFEIFSNNGGSHVVGQPNTAVIRGGLVATTPTGEGAAFATYETGIGVRALAANEQDTIYPDFPTETNIRLTLSGTTTISGVDTNTLQLDNNSGAPATLLNTGVALDPVHGLLFTGTSAITLSGGSLTFNNGGFNADLPILSTNSAGVTILTSLTSVNTPNIHRSFTFGGSGNITVAGSIAAGGGGGVYYNGTESSLLTLGGPFTGSSAGLVINSGSARLGAGFSLPNQVSAVRLLRLAAGASLNMNGVSAPFDYLTDQNGAGGTITNSSPNFSTLTLTFVNSGTAGIGTTSFSGNITGNLNLVETATNAGNVAIQFLSGSNTYAGFTTINSGNLRIGANNALPVTTDLTVDGQSSAAGSSLELGGFNQTVVSLSGVVSSGTAIISNLISGTSTLTISGTTNTSFGGSLLEGGTAGAVLALVKSGNGSLALGGSSNYSGGTVVNAGALRINGLLTGTGATSVAAGATLGGTGTSASLVTVSASGRLSPGNNAAGTLTLAGLTLSGSSILDYEFSGGVNDRIVVAGTNGLTISGSNSINLFQQGSGIAFSTPGTYTLLQYLGNLLGGGSIGVANPQSFRSYTTGTAGGSVTLTIVSTAVSGTWAGTTGNSWGVPTNWLNNFIPDTAGALATFPAVAQTSVNLDGNRTLGDLLFNNAAGYTIASGTGGTLVFDNGTNAASITDSLGVHIISAPISLVSSNTVVTVSGTADKVTLSGPISGNSSLLKGGNGVLALTGSNSFNGGSSLNGGVTQINNGNSLGITGGSVSVGSATLEALNDVVTTGSLQLASASSTIQVDGTSVFQVTGNVTNASGAGNLNKTGPGTFLVGGLANALGSASLQSGTLQIGTGLATGNTSVAALTGSGAFLQNGSTVVLSGANNTYSGLMTVINGSLILATNSPTATGTGGLILNSSTLTAATTTTIGSNAGTGGPFTTLTINGAVVIDPGSNLLTIASQLSGTAGTSITRTSGTGTLGFGVTGGSTFTNGGFAGSVTSTIGNVSFFTRNAGSLLAQWTFTGGGLVSLGNPGGTIVFGSLAGTNDISSTGSQARMNVGNLGLSTTYSGIIGISGGASIGILKTGTGTLTLSGQNLYSGNALTAIGGLPTVITAGALAAGSSTVGATSGPFGPTNGISPTMGTSTGLILLGNNGVLSNASLVTSGSVTIGNPIVVSSGTGINLTAVLRLGGVTDNNSSFTGGITLENDLTVTQVATSPGRALTIASDIRGTVALTGPASTAINATNALTNSGTQTLTFAGPGRINVTGTVSNGTASAVRLSNTGGITTLSGAMLYSGSTSITGGTLVVAASISGTNNSAGFVSVSGSGTLAGGGAINLAAGNQVLSGSGATIAPGNVDVTTDASLIGKLTINDVGTPAPLGTLRLATGSILSLQLSGTTAGVTYDQVSVFGTISLAGAELQGTLLNGYLPQINDKFFIMLNNGSDPIIGLFAQGTSVTFGDATFNINYADNGDGGGTANDISLTAIAVVPEPGTSGFMLMGAGLFVAARRFARRYWL